MVGEEEERQGEEDLGMDEREEKLGMDVQGLGIGKCKLRIEAREGHMINLPDELEQAEWIQEELEQSESKGQYLQKKGRDKCFLGGDPVSNSNQLKPSPQCSTKIASQTPPISDIPSTPTNRPPPADTDVIHVPSYSRWFSWDKIDYCESHFLPEFSDRHSPSKGLNLYMYYRNSIITLFRENPSCKITFTDARRNLVGDVGSIRRVFDFLDLWGLINHTAFSALSKPSKYTAPNNKSSDSPSTTAPTRKPFSTSRRLCGACKVGLSNVDFRRVEIGDEAKTDWSEKETLLLLEAIKHYGDDWKKDEQHVGGRTEKNCVAHFVKFPFGEEYLGHPFSENVESELETNKMMSVTPSTRTRTSTRTRLDTSSRCYIDCSKTFT
ncbi:Detected protein of confused Function [Hibiscus syriacus]|uniref:Detected protein of confused Function n=1 Tax=Hibiscus syriacus TaxID=106335 RepID=A0A6A2WDQ1_HIBSY|nr:Detected protein of confused Function [Hibiscus syriacus]